MNEKYENVLHPSHLQQGSATYLDEPREELAILHKRMPLAQLPIHVLQRRDRLDANATEQHDDAARVGGDESQHEAILAGAIVTLEDGIAQGALGMELDLIRPAPDEVMDEVGPSPPRPDGVAEPLVRLDATSDACRVVYAAVATRVGGEVDFVVVIDEEIVRQYRLVVEGPAGGGVLHGIRGVVGVVVVGLLLVLVLLKPHLRSLLGRFFNLGDCDWFLFYFRHGSLGYVVAFSGSSVPTTSLSAGGTDRLTVESLTVRFFLMLF